MQLSNVQLVRRNSLSLRDIPPGSIADEILKSTHFSRARSLLSDIKDMRETLSDFGSCQSSVSSSSEDDSDEETTGNKSGEEFKTMNSKKKAWKLKRKLSQTPTNETFLKKPNLTISPQ